MFCQSEINYCKIYKSFLCFSSCANFSPQDTSPCTEKTKFLFPFTLNGSGRGDSFPFDFEPTGFPFGSKLRGNHDMIILCFICHVMNYFDFFAYFFLYFIIVLEIVFVFLSNCTDICIHFLIFYNSFSGILQVWVECNEILFVFICKLVSFHVFCCNFSENFHVFLSKHSRCYFLRLTTLFVS